MSIKNVKPTKKSGYHQGYIDISECAKYRGSGPIIYRSLWEKKFAYYCERTPEIVWWSSESFSIQYFSPIDNKYHKYYPDFIFQLSNNQIVIAEIKPKAQLQKPELPKRKTSKAVESYKWGYNTWVVNMAKKQAAIEFANSRGYKYLLITEDFFKGK